MVAWQTGAIALAVVLVFWMVGAYNRLASLRNAAGAAGRSVGEAIGARAAAVAPLLVALRGPLAAEAAALDALLAANAQADEAGSSLCHPGALRPDAALAVARTEAAFGPACARVVALAEAEPAARALGEVEAALGALRELAPRLAFARQSLDEAVQAYDAAIGQWPTRLLAQLYGFAPLGAAEGAAAGAD